ncbi:DUF6229 family protein [Luteimonas sp. RD2P54]|uniref:DUF6229 family protein n=1 Tax=Luteimonas endophytica TaxID=3042023 RepID=A0ABT6J9I1_9GAMM|nr:DUF6229 family protein [Luteimonas endophytica]MDH5822863.1 DUF6229 family protein [Luteimonas endophytica]
MNGAMHEPGVVAQWRNDADAGNPAGPLFISGEYAEADIVSEKQRATFFTLCGCGTACTGSQTRQCC